MGDPVCEDCSGTEFRQAQEGRTKSQSVGYGAPAFAEPNPRPGLYVCLGCNAKYTTGEMRGLKQ